MMADLIGRGISIHASRVGGDARPRRQSKSCRNFNPRLPGGRRQPLSQVRLWYYWISIHASRVGGDFIDNPMELNYHLISIHASRVGGDNPRATASTE